MRNTAAEERATSDEIARVTGTTTALRSDLELALVDEAAIVAELDAAIAGVAVAAERVADAKSTAEALGRALESARQRHTELTAAAGALAEINERLPLLREEASDSNGTLARRANSSKPSTPSRSR